MTLDPGDREEKKRGGRPLTHPDIRGDVKRECIIRQSDTLRSNLN